jgi:Methyltransferase domain
MSGTNETGRFEWFVEEFSYFRGRTRISGWAFHTEQAVIGVEGRVAGGEFHGLSGYGASSADVEAVHGPRARDCRFTFDLPTPDSATAIKTELTFTLSDESRHTIGDLGGKAFSIDPCQRLIARFFDSLEASGFRSVLEVGSRNRTGQIQRGRIPQNWTYTGLDVLAGENVDIVGDAHELSRIFPVDNFDAAFSMAVFEHLAMPWKVVLEMNHILKRGALAMIVTHQVFPIHEYPWDFFRFSDRAWSSILNKYTGFEIIETAMSRGCNVVPHILVPGVIGLDEGPGYIHSAVIARKISETFLSWNVPLDAVVTDPYPQ